MLSARLLRTLPDDLEVECFGSDFTPVRAVGHSAVDEIVRVWLRHADGTEFAIDAPYTWGEMLEDTIYNVLQEVRAFLDNATNPF